MGSVRMRDKAPGAPDFEFEIDLASAELTAAELIRGRVTMELARGAEGSFRPLVDQSAEEQLLNGPRPVRTAPEIEQAVSRAISAFRSGRFVLLVDGRQVESASDVVTLTPASEVTFVRLLPLRGG